MVKIELTDTSLVLHVEGADKLWSLKSRLEVPLAHVAGIERDEEEARAWWHGIKAPGTNIPHVITAGTFHQHGERVFWDVHRPEHAVAIRLADESYQRLVVEVEDVDATIAAVRGAIVRH
ncbi:MAG TPA: hypothetical protein VGG74_12810 [Kofleriaceae bacterium]|jgi:hypothetical protein